MISLSHRTLAPVLLACMLTSSRALAQADPLASEARQRFQEGVALHDAKREEEAYGKFSQAYAILKAPAVIFNLARTEELTGRLLDAAAHFKQYLALPDQPKVTAELRRQARDFLSDVRAKLGHIQVTTAAGASLLLDGQPAGTAPPPEAIDVMPGAHQLEARLGTKSKAATFSVAADQVQAVSLDLSEAPLPPPPPQPALPAPTPPPRAESPSAGAASTRTWLALGLGAVALGSVATGAGFELAAGNSASTAGGLRSQLLSSGPSPCSSGASSSTCQQLQNANQSAQNQHNLAAGFFVAGGVFAAATVAVLLWPQHHDDSAQVTFSPTPTGFQLSGDF
jgi:hypothetical protein